MAIRAACLTARERWLREGGEPSEEADAGALIVAEDGWNLAQLRGCVEALVKGLARKA